MLRLATLADAPEIWRVRYLVTENRLTPGRLDHALLDDYLLRHGRGWVVDLGGGRIAGFSIGDARDGNICALFVDPACEGQGHGRRLHSAMVDWLFAQGLTRLNLGTEPDSRAEAFYRRAGWRESGEGLDSHGDLRLELTLNDWKTAHAASPRD